MPVDVRTSPTDLQRAIAYDNHRSVRKHADVFWKTLKDDARKIRGLRLSPLGAVVLKKVRIISDYTIIFSPETRGRAESSVNADTGVEEVPPCLCALAPPKLLKEFVRPRQRFPTPLTGQLLTEEEHLVYTMAYYDIYI